MIDTENRVILGVYEITPVPKPRMTQRDRWKKRPATTRYYQYKDLVQILGVKVPEHSSHIHFILEMPKSWSKKKRNEMRGQPHQQRPDKDNLEKALLDSLFEEDCQVWDGRVSKWWGDSGAIVIEEIPSTSFPTVF